jgi:hypothetical protein
VLVADEEVEGTPPLFVLDACVPLAPAFAEVIDAESPAAIVLAPAADVASACVLDAAVPAGFDVAASSAADVEEAWPFAGASAPGVAPLAEVELPAVLLAPT